MGSFGLLKKLSEKKSRSFVDIVDIVECLEGKNNFVKDDRKSCWWCDYWKRDGRCINGQYSTQFALANGTLQRCPGFKGRLSPIPENMGLCVSCGSWTPTEVKSLWITDPNNSKLRLLKCGRCQDRKRKRDEYLLRKRGE